MNTRAYLLLGSNIGNRGANLRTALVALSAIGKITKESSIYETAAWGKTDQPPFYNQVVEIQTTVRAHELLAELLGIEVRMGRIRTSKWGERTIDIDILFYGEEIIEAPQLTIPHPQLQFRRFTLAPLNEIAPALKHPKLKTSIYDLLTNCPDVLPVEIVAKRVSDS